MTEQEQKQEVAVHESGHALLYVAQGIDFEKVHIRSYAAPGAVRRKWTGTTFPSTGTNAALESRIAILWGGRAAEEVCFGNYGSGCEEDFAQLRKLAKEYPDEWDSASAVGTTTAKNIVRKFRDALNGICRRLMKSGCLTCTEVREIFDARPDSNQPPSVSNAGNTPEESAS